MLGLVTRSFFIAVIEYKTWETDENKNEFCALENILSISFLVISYYMDDLWNFEIYCTLISFKSLYIKFRCACVSNSSPPKLPYRYWWNFFCVLKGSNGWFLVMAEHGSWRCCRDPENLLQVFRLSDYFLNFSDKTMILNFQPLSTSQYF